MRVLVACEYSGRVRDAFLDMGHNAWSCDLLPTESPRGFHYQGDIKDILYDGWDLLIAHPPCTFLASSGSRWLYHPDDKHLPVEERRPHPLYPDRKKDRQDAIDFFMMLWNAPIPHIAVEKPRWRHVLCPKEAGSNRTSLAIWGGSFQSHLPLAEELTKTQAYKDRWQRGDCNLV